MASSRRNVSTIGRTEKRTAQALEHTPDTRTMSLENTIGRVLDTSKHGRERSFGNGRVKPYRDDGRPMVAVYLFGNRIALFDLCAGAFTLSNAGYQSNTTRRWLRGLLSKFQSDDDERGLVVRKRTWYTSDPMQYVNGRKRKRFDPDTPTWDDSRRTPLKFKLRKGCFPAHEAVREQFPKDIAGIIFSFL